MTAKHPRYVRTDNKHEPLRTFEFYDGDHTPSWERPGQSANSHGGLKITTHAENPWLQFVANEASDRSRRETFITLNANEGRQLYVWLGKLYGAAS